MYARLSSPKRDLVRLQHHGQPNGCGCSTGQELASSQAKSTASATLSGSSGASRTRRSGTSRALRGSGRTGNAGRNRRGWKRSTKRERACALDLLKDVGRESSGHVVQRKLCGERQCGVPRVLGVLCAERLDPDEAELGGKNCLRFLSHHNDERDTYY